MERLLLKHSNALLLLRYCTALNIIRFHKAGEALQAEVRSAIEVLRIGEVE